jgi:hypothetical protein
MRNVAWCAGEGLMVMLAPFQESCLHQLLYKSQQSSHQSAYFAETKLILKEFESIEQGHWLFNSRTRYGGADL